MSKLTKADIASFGKVLSVIGTSIEQNPSLLLDIINSSTDSKKQVKEKVEISDEVKCLNIFEAFKDSKKSEIESKLLKFNKEELKFLVKTFSLGSTRLTSAEKLADFIADQISKRTTDVFINQE
ncbi:hypothetical protein AB6D77_23290 [Vibrio splendidus]